jgi:hypothetical protein
MPKYIEFLKTYSFCETLLVIPFLVTPTLLCVPNFMLWSGILDIDRNNTKEIESL